LNDAIEIEKYIERKREMKRREREKRERREREKKNGDKFTAIDI